jgi:hypothetical protein
MMETLWEYSQAVRKLESPKNTHIDLYRGQSDQFPLLPSLFRKPNTVAAVKKTESGLLQALKDSIPNKIPRPENDWDWLSFGQHFGLPTRLLDWSENHLTALFFAVKDSPKAPVVFVYHARKSQIVTSDEKKASPFSISITRIMKPKPPNIRATLQEAWHTVHKTYRMKGRETFRPLNDMRIHDSRIDIIRINPASAKRIQGELRRLLGITSAALYGEFDSICESIRHDFGMP